MSFRTKLFTLRYSPNHITPPVAGRYLSSQFNCLQPKIAHMYKNRDRSVLWWMVSAHNLVSHKRVVRTWLARRMRAAFQQALKEHGFNSQGKRLAPPPLRRQGGRDFGDLTGTVEISINPRSLREDLSQLDKSMAVTLGTILRHRQEEAKTPVAGGAAVGKKWAQAARR
ncbi:uncharacterized protein LDX57_009242 [Aspergillus melleus]|uniref:uncharacterized protein n=1 Tax=Aspergillus melleus TaxID=138277 RepID=UPI001E8D302F|nr:uncharacterized protein LDX57_009242 [Aspergillus melleus]KAH8431583.1 hypothetical protein LDX57_009242 [Aspergillus melleus]